jgi:hypothetical protein
MNKIKLLITILIVIFCLPSQALAGDFDGSKPLICAVIEAFDCAPDEDCQPGNAQIINLPQFLKINFKEKTITGNLESGELRTTKILGMERINGKLILQGVEEGMGWSMVVTENSGKMALSASGDQMAFIVFGACTPHSR